MSNKLFAALGIFVVWVAITMFGPRVQLGSGERPLDDLVTGGIAWWLVAAVVFLVAAVAVLGWWRQVGLKSAEPSSSWKLIWFPVLMILLFFSVALMAGLPAPAVIGFVLFNTLLVGISEELMTRGFLLYGALTKWGIWASIIFVTLIFGGIHVLNGFGTGDFFAATVQAVAAAMSGLLFIALRLRTLSLIPGIVMHWLWDFAVFQMQIAMKSMTPASEAGTLHPSTAQLIVFPLLMALPGFLYGLWLLRKIGQRNKLDLIGD